MLGVLRFMLSLCVYLPQGHCNKRMHEAWEKEQEDRAENGLFSDSRLTGLDALLIERAVHNINSQLFFYLSVEENVYGKPFYYYYAK